MLPRSARPWRRSRPALVHGLVYGRSTAGSRKAAVTRRRYPARQEDLLLCQHTDQTDQNGIAVDQQRVVLVGDAEQAPIRGKRKSTGGTAGRADDSKIIRAYARLVLVARVRGLGRGRPANLGAGDPTVACVRPVGPSLRPARMNEPGGVRHPIFARMYASSSARVEARGAGLHRVELLAGLTGRVIEVGAGNGLNFAHYPDTVTLVVAVEPEPHLRTLAAEAATAAVSVRVIGGLAEALPAQTATFDAGVASLVLCSVGEQQPALRELFRVIRPGGELRFYEHVRATTPILGPLLRLAQASFWPLLAGGCHPARHTEAAIREAGFVIEALHEFRFSPSRPLPAIPHILGVARRPEPGRPGFSA